MNITNQYSLTVIIPNYNKEKYIEKCISSILNQTLLPDEIIIVDDCSTDKSRSIIDRIKNKNSIIKSIYLDKNGGVSNARNIGLKYATSDYITFTDSDDFYYNRDKLKNEMSLIKEKSPEDIVAYSPYGRCNEKGSIVSIPQLEPGFFLEGDIFSDLLAKQFMNVPRDYIIKKEIIEKVGAYCFPRNFFEDYDLLIRISKEIKFYCTYELGIMYRLTGSGLSVRSSKEYKNTLTQIVDSYLLMLPMTDRVIIKFKTLIYKAKNKIIYLETGKRNLNK